MQKNHQWSVSVNGTPTASSPEAADRSVLGKNTRRDVYPPRQTKI